jgi:MarR family transcriptional regulator for hemolysin
MQQNPKHIFGYRLGLLARHWRQEVNDAVKVLDLTEATWRPLLHLHHLGDAVRQKDLALSLGLDGSSLVRLLDMLEERGLVRRTDGADRRCKLLTLTAEGRALTERTRAIVTALEEHMLGDLNAAEAATMLELMDRIECRMRHGREAEE